MKDQFRTGDLIQSNIINRPRIVGIVIEKVTTKDARDCGWDRNRCSMYSVVFYENNVSYSCWIPESEIMKL